MSIAHWASRRRLGKPVDCDCDCVVAAVVTAWVAEPYVIALWASATSPRAIAPRANLTEAEQTTIKLYQTASPSVVHVFARAIQGISLFEPEGNHPAIGSGIIWDAAGHVVTHCSGPAGFSGRQGWARGRRNQWPHRCRRGSVLRKISIASSGTAPATAEMP
jgi:hypothetical protein